MQNNIDINFEVTASQKETIQLRAAENGFDEISSYLKVVALKTQAFTTAPLEERENPTLTLTFKVTETQNTIIKENMKNNGFEKLEKYLCYVALHGVVTAVVEVRSTGSLDAMLQRIADAKKR